MSTNDIQFEAVISHLANGGRWDLVARYARQWLAIAPEHPDAHRWLAWALFSMGQRWFADWHVAEVARLEPDEPSTFRLLAEKHIHAERWDEAAQNLAEAIERSPDRDEYWCMQAFVDLERRRYDSARAAAEVAMSLDPDDIGNRLVHILARYAGVRGPDAGKNQIEELIELLADDPENTLILTAIADVYLRSLQSASAALEYYEAALAIDPTDAAVEHQVHYARWACQAVAYVDAFQCEAPVSVVLVDAQ